MLTRRGVSSYLYQMEWCRYTEFYIRVNYVLIPRQRRTPADERISVYVTSQTIRQWKRARCVQINVSLAHPPHEVLPCSDICRCLACHRGYVFSSARVVQWSAAEEVGHRLVVSTVAFRWLRLVDVTPRFHDRLSNAQILVILAINIGFRNLHLTVDAHGAFRET